MSETNPETSSAPEASKEVEPTVSDDSKPLEENSTEKSQETEETKPEKSDDKENPSQKPDDDSKTPESDHEDDNYASAEDNESDDDDENNDETRRRRGDSDDENNDASGSEEAPSDADEKVDDDEDRRNPQYIPKRGMFYEHDDRIDSEEEAEMKKKLAEEEAKKKKRVWKSEATDRWGHDKYMEMEQTPKSKEELVRSYGYDIRNEDNAPRARRRRRYGRGPNKYTRDWKDENAYSGRGGTAVGRPPARGQKSRAFTKSDNVEAPKESVAQTNEPVGRRDSNQQHFADREERSYRDNSYRGRGGGGRGHRGSGSERRGGGGRGGGGRGGYGPSSPSTSSFQKKKSFEKVPPRFKNTDSLERNVKNMSIDEGRGGNKPRSNAKSNSPGESPSMMRQKNNHENRSTPEQLEDESTPGSSNTTTAKRYSNLRNPKPSSGSPEHTNSRTDSVSSQNHLKNAPTRGSSEEFYDASAANNVANEQYSSGYPNENTEVNSSNNSYGNSYTNGQSSGGSSYRQQQHHRQQQVSQPSAAPYMNNGMVNYGPPVQYTPVTAPLSLPIVGIPDPMVAAGGVPGAPMLPAHITSVVPDQQVFIASGSPHPMGGPPAPPTAGPGTPTGYAVERGGVTYFNPSAQVPVVPRSVNKRPKAAIPIVDPRGGDDEEAKESTNSPQNMTMTSGEVSTET